MNRYFLASHSHHSSHQSRDLGHLSPERKKYLVMDVVYKMHPNNLLWCLRHPHELLIDLGPYYVPGRWMFSVEEILEQYPPDPSVADRINLAQPPLWLWWPHGKRLFVRIAEELVRQPPGYGPTSEGPWPAGFVFPSAWPWKDATKGPFAPPPASYPEQYEHFPPGGDHAVFAPQPLFYNDRMLCAGVIFSLEVPSKDHEFLQKGIVIKVPSYAQPIKYASTGWWVVDQPMLHDYARRYETCDLTGIVPSRPGRKRGSKRVPPHTDLFKVKLESIVRRLRVDFKGTREVSPQDVCLDQEWREWQDSSSLSTFYRRIGEHGINFPEFLSSLSTV